jgi:hypothetical protein
VNHHQQILATTQGHPASYNDRIVVLFNKSVYGIHDSKKLSNQEFTLGERDVSGKVVKQKFKGCWLLSNNSTNRHEI